MTGTACEEREAAITLARFRYEAPTTVADAITLLADGQGEARVLAGGQSLITMMKTRLASPETVVDINGLSDLAYLRRDADGSIRVGALCRHADLERSEFLAVDQPTMASAAPVIGDPLIRNRGTLVGALCHADPRGDWAAVMAAVGGHVVARGPRGEHSIPVSEFVTGPFQNSLAFDELAIEVVVPPPQGTPAGGYLKMERRIGDFASVGVAVALQRVGDRVVRAGVALTGVGPQTVPAVDAADVLTGQDLTTDAIDEAARLAASAAQPQTNHRGSAAYKRQLVEVFTRRILTRILRSKTDTR